jgi:putative transposase
MARIPWVVAPGFPHHVTQRGISGKDDSPPFCWTSATFWQRRDTWNSFRFDKLTTGRYGQGWMKVKALLEMVGDWQDFLLGGVAEQELERIRRHEKTGRPLGNDGFVANVQEALARILQRQKPGRKNEPKQK